MFFVFPAPFSCLADDYPGVEAREFQVLEKILEQRLFPNPRDNEAIDILRMLYRKAFSNTPDLEFLDASEPGHVFPYRLYDPLGK